MRVRLGLVIALWALASGAFAQNKVTDVKVNGFQVYLVDIEKGNQFGYVFAVPYGSADDAPQFFGRAHFFEHMYSRGSKRYPGHETLIEAMTGFGYQRNAATALDHTYYYALGHQQHGLKAMGMHLAGLEELHLESSSLTREKATVVNEIINSAPSRPQRALYTLPFVLLPEVGHQSRGEFLGTHQTLDPMSADDLRDLHRRVYHAGNVKLAVFANFKTGPYTRDQIAKELETMLPKSDAPQAPYVPAQNAPIFAQDQILDMASAKDRAGMIFLPLAPGADIAAVETFAELFTTPFRNGVLDTARAKFGWLQNIGAFVGRVGAEQFLILNLSMTDAGYSNREKLAQWILDSIRVYQESSFSEELLANKRNEFLKGHTVGQESLELLQGWFADWLGQPNKDAELHLDWQKAVAVYNNETIRAGARAIQFQNKAISFLGPAAINATETNSFYNLKYGTRPWREQRVDLPLVGPDKIEIPVVELPQISEQGPELQRNDWQQTEGWAFIQAHRADWSDRTVHVNLEFGDLSVLEQLSLQAWIGTAFEQLQPELTVLQAQGIDLNFSLDNRGELEFFARGNTGKEAAAVSWLIEKARQFRPPADMLARKRNSMQMGLQRDEEGFPGQKVVGVVRDLLAQRAPRQPQSLQQILALTPAAIEDFVTKVAVRSYKTVSVAGAYRQSEIDQLVSSVKALSPKDWLISPMRSMARFEVQSNLDYVEGWQNAQQTSVGAARLFAAPTGANIRERVAISLVSKLLHEQVFLRNRPLGYVQGVSPLSTSPGDRHVIFYGQTNSPAELPQLRSVWDSELARWREHKVDTATIEKGRSGLVAEFSEQTSTSADELARRAGALQTHGDPFYQEKLLATARTLTIDEIYAAADKYLGAQQAVLNVTKGASDPLACGAIVAKREVARRSLRVAGS